MTTLNDGGPAFPCEQGQCQDGTWNQTYDPGMSLRDWFAGQALAGMTANPNKGNVQSHTLAGMAYFLADAMLAARQEPRP